MFSMIDEILGDQGGFQPAAPACMSEFMGAEICPVPAILGPSMEHEIGSLETAEFPPPRLQHLQSLIQQLVSMQDQWLLQ